MRRCDMSDLAFRMNVMDVDSRESGHGWYVGLGDGSWAWAGCGALRNITCPIPRATGQRVQVDKMATFKQRREIYKADDDI
jgi:hypothetical protein